MNRFLVFLLIIISSPAFSQVNPKLKKLISKSDSLILVSNQHDEPAQDVRLEGEPLPPPKKQLQLVTSRNKLDYSTIVERIKLQSEDREQLIEIMGRTNPGPYPGTKCIPIYHHAILIYRAGSVSWVQICFHCFQAEASKNLSNYFVYDDRILAGLWSLFKSKGFKYQMPDEEHVKSFVR